MSDGHRVAVYYQTQYDSSLPANSPYGHYVSPLPLIAVITHLFIAAFHLNTDVTVHINNFPPESPMYDQMWTDVAQMQAQGVKALGMLGGAAPGTFSSLTDANFDTFYPVLSGYISRYKLDGMDLDVEENTSLETIVHLITQLKADFGDGFIITLAPVASALTEGSNLSGFDYIQLEKTIGNKISWYNAQFYGGFGSFFPEDQYISIVEFAGLDPSRLVAATLTNSANGDGFVSPDNVVSSVKALSGKYGFSFGGVAGFEYFNSLPNATEPWQWATLMSSSMTDLKKVRESIASRKSSRVIYMRH